MKHMSKHGAPKLIVPVARPACASFRASGHDRKARDRAEKTSTGVGRREAPGRHLSDIRGVDYQGTFNHEFIPLLAHHSVAKLK